MTTQQPQKLIPRPTKTNHGKALFVLITHKRKKNSNRSAFEKNLVLQKVDLEQIRKFNVSKVTNFVYVIIEKNQENLNKAYTTYNVNRLGKNVNNKNKIK